MNIDNFLNLQPQQQVDCINKLLKEHSLDEAATLLKISKSKLSAMMKEGNFVLIKSLNQYCSTYLQKLTSLFPHALA